MHFKCVSGSTSTLRNHLDRTRKDYSNDLRIKELMSRPNCLIIN